MEIRRGSRGEKHGHWGLHTRRSLEGERPDIWQYPQDRRAAPRVSQDRRGGLGPNYHLESSVFRPHRQSGRPWLQGSRIISRKRNRGGYQTGTNHTSKERTNTTLPMSSRGGLRTTSRTERCIQPRALAFAQMQIGIFSWRNFIAVVAPRWTSWVVKSTNSVRECISKQCCNLEVCRVPPSSRQPCGRVNDNGAARNRASVFRGLN